MSVGCTRATTTSICRGLLAACLALLPPSLGGASLTGCGFDCNVMDAEGVGTCTRGLGYAREPSLTDCGCGPVIGCSCEGADCNELFARHAECTESLAKNRRR